MNRTLVCAVAGLAAVLSGCEDKSGNAPVAPTSAAAVVPSASAGASASPSAAVESIANKTAVDTLRKAIDERYSYRDRLALDWDQLFEKSRAGLLAAPSRTAFAQGVGALLATARDPHILVEHDGARVVAYDTHPVANIVLTSLRKSLTGWKQPNPCLISARVGTDIGYVLLGSFDHATCSGVVEAFAAALTELADAKALILDARANGGGDETLALGIAARFVDAPVVYGKVETRDLRAPGGFTPTATKVVHPIAGTKRFARPVAVLMGPVNMSSAESFLLMMRAAGAKLVGEKSLGASGNPLPIDLGNGVTVKLPSWRAMLPDGARFEGIGLAPDVLVKAGQRELADRDLVIEAAARILRGGT